MTKKPRDRVILTSSRDRVTKKSQVEKLMVITCAYGRARAREEYVRAKQVTQDERKRGVWRSEFGGNYFITCQETENLLIDGDN